MSEEDHPKNEKAPANYGTERAGIDRNGQEAARGHSMGVDHKSSRLLFLLILIGVVIAIVFGVKGEGSGAPRELTWSQFLTELEQGDYREVNVYGHEVVAKYAPGAPHHRDKARTHAPDPIPVSELDEIVKDYKGAVTINYEPPRQLSVQLRAWIPWLLLMFSFYLFVYRRLRGGNARTTERGGTPAKTNNVFFIALWTPVLVLLGLLSVGFVFSILWGSSTHTIPLVGALVLGVGLLLFFRHQQRTFDQMFQQPDPAVIVEFITRHAGRIVDGHYYTSATAAVVLAQYGRTEEAKRILDAVCWQEVAPFIEAQRLHALAMIAFVEGDSNGGLELAQSALRQSELSPGLPGAKASQLVFQSYRNLGLVLCGEASPETCQQLQLAMSKLPVLGRMVPAWALAVQAKRKGDQMTADNLRQLIAAHAPHFSGVLRSIDAVKVQSSAHQPRT